MKKAVLIACLLALTSFDSGSLIGSTVQGQENHFEELARRIVQTSVTIKPGDVVVVEGGKHTIPLMEAIAIEAQKAGGQVAMFLISDRVSRSLNVEVPEQYLEQEPMYYAEWLKHMDVYIGLPSFENPKGVFADVPEARSAKLAKAEQFIDKMLDEAKVRCLFIGYPTKEMAALNQVAFPTYERMHWDAVNADYRRISEQGEALRKRLQEAKVVRITSPSGTDFRFAVGDRPIFIDDGIVTQAEAQAKLALARMAGLPGGSIYLSPIETSANGRVVVPNHRCRYQPLRGISFEFKNGKLENFKADQGADCFQETMAPYPGPKDMFGWIEIGLNPARRVMENPGDYRPTDAAGLVWIGIGNNSLLGGKNATPGEFNFPIVKATVEIDGQVVVRDGRLVL